MRGRGLWMPSNSASIGHNIVDEYGCKRYRRMNPSDRSALTPSPPVRRGRRFATALVPYIFLAPFAALFLAFTVAPLVYASYTSVFRDTLVGGTQFAGFANYLRAFSDLKFWGGIAHLALFGVVQVPIMLGLALAFALVLDR